MSSLYPAPRVRPLGAAPQVAELFGRVETTEVEVTLADTDATVIDFSGAPQFIALTARTNGALVTLTNRGNLETHELVVLANQRIEVRLSRERVVGRNLVAGNNAVLFVEGYYAAEPEPYRGRRAAPPGADSEATETWPESGALEATSDVAARPAMNSAGFRG